MQNFFVATAETFKPWLLGFQNPFTAMFRQYASHTASTAEKESVHNLDRMARDVERLQPSLAAELRSFASRN